MADNRFLYIFNIYGLIFFIYVSRFNTLRVKPQLMLITDIEDKINQIYPLSEAQEWDNVGVLVDTGSSSNKVLLTIDVTELVIDECNRLGIKDIISYHPVIFSGVKKLLKNDIVTKLIKFDINVFCPHTSWDEEMNRYLFCLLDNQNVEQVFDTLKNKIGLKHIRVANMSAGRKSLVVGVGSAFKYHEYKNSLIVTGEMSHHCLLHSIRHNNTVILLEHSNSERVVLPYFKDKLEKILPECDIFISKNDKDPIDIL